VSHYWDCRLKGRPPGTKKSTDPDKKKRKRVARERDLCDVKIKITEYFDQQEYTEQVGQRPPGAEDDVGSPVTAELSDVRQQQQFFGQAQMMPQQWDMPPGMSQAGIEMPQFTSGLDTPLSTCLPPRKYYTFQRVNGNGGNGKGDGVAGPHKHTLEESDRVKKNSVVRWLAKCEKDDRRKPQVSLLSNVSYSLSSDKRAWIFLIHAVYRFREITVHMRDRPCQKPGVDVECHDATTCCVADHPHNVILMLMGSCPKMELQVLFFTPVLRSLLLLFSCTPVLDYSITFLVCVQNLQRLLLSRIDRLSFHVSCQLHIQHAP
jgi:hypothetical protein